MKNYKELKQKRKGLISEKMFRLYCDYYEQNKTFSEGEALEQSSKTVANRVSIIACGVEQEEFISVFMKKKSRFMERI